MAVKQDKKTRKRGVILSPKGLQRLQKAIVWWEKQENQGHHLTLEELSEHTNISTKTLSRLWSANKGVDQKTLKLCFNTFNLELNNDDYIFLNEENKQQRLKVLSNNLCTQNQNNSMWLYPDGPVPLNSPLYIERSPIEKLIYQELMQPGCIIRIQSPTKMGKTSLIIRLLAFADQQGYHTVNLSFTQIDNKYLTDFSNFLRCFCCQIATKLGLDPKIDNYWHEEIGYKLTCSFYLQEYILKQVNQPIVIVLSEVDHFFNYPDITHEFFALLYSWCEEVRKNPLWSKLRLVVAYATEQVVGLNINHSPFNIGLPIQLNEFTQEQVEELARRYQLNWTTGKESALLISLIGGHPGMVQLGFYHLSLGHITLPKLIEDAISNGGIYRQHLSQLWSKLQLYSHLMPLFTQVVATKESMFVNPSDADQLDNLGLITFVGDRVLPRCQLYRVYFHKQLDNLSKLEHKLENRIVKEEE
ncbi:MAG: hypothetical protein EAZ87_12975 [Nostocales cyanobacterium]|nr:MAG: hypothetical protein EAZ87_12975 [Nostocales cyanobacterium]